MKEVKKVLRKKILSDLSQKDLWFQPGLVLFSRLSGWIGGPVIVALFLGKKVDEKLSSEPWGFLFCVGIAFILSSIGIVWEAQRAIKEIEENEKKK